MFMSLTLVAAKVSTGDRLLQDAAHEGVLALDVADLPVGIGPAVFH